MTETYDVTRNAFFFIYVHAHYLCWTIISLITVLDKVCAYDLLSGYGRNLEFCFVATTGT